MISLILALIILSFLVAVHEGGHFLAARLCGVTVEKFSIGFGKPIIKFIKGGVEYSLAWIPLGGYVKMKGENPENLDNEPGGFLNSPWWKRAIIAFAGPFTNLIFAFLILMLSFMFTQKISDHNPVIDQVNPPLAEYFQSGDRLLEINGESVKGWYTGLALLNENKENKIIIEREGEKLEIRLAQVKIADWTNHTIIRPQILPRVGEVMPKSPAYNAGIESGDLLLSIDGSKVSNWYEMNQEIEKNDADIELVIQRGDSKLTKTLSKMELPNEDRRIIGITQYFPVTYSSRLSFYQALVSGFSSTTSMVAMNYVGLYQIIRKPQTIKNNIGGPVMIFTTGRDYIKQGIAKGLQFVGFLNIVLMVMNLLPIPVLDGGHILFSFIEGIRGKRLSFKVQMLLQQVGVLLLLAMMIYAFYSDFHGLIARYYRN